MESSMEKYIVFLRGINVGGYHKVPMVELKAHLKTMGFHNIETILNTGNILFDAPLTSLHTLETSLAKSLEKKFGFPIPTLARTRKSIQNLLDQDPFQNIELTKDLRFYISFAQHPLTFEHALPWVSDDQSFKILSIEDQTIISLLDLSVTKTPKGMEILEKWYGKTITTRNWNTIKRIEKKLKG